MSPPDASAGAPSAEASSQGLDRAAGTSLGARLGAAALAEILGCVDEAVLVANSAGTVIALNRSARELLGFPLPEGGLALGEFLPRVEAERPTGERVSAGDRPIVRALSGDAVAPSELRFRVRGTRTEFLALVDARRIETHDEGGPLVVVTLRDVTDARRREAELREAERRERARAEELRTVLDTVPAYVLITRDRAASRVDGNRLVLAAMGASPGANLAPAVHVYGSIRRRGREVDPPDLPLQRAARTGEAVEGDELLFTFPDGHERWFLGNTAPLRDERGEPHGAVGAFVDITERKHAEQALQANEEWFRTLIDTIPQMIWVSEPERGNVFNNSRLAQYTGLSNEELRGFDGWVRVLDPADAAVAQKEWARMAAGREQSYTAMARIRRHDGVYRWCHIAMEPLRDATGRVSRWIGTWTDVHDRILAEDRLREEDHRKSQFLAVLSHELRNPLSPIANALHILDRSAPGSQQAAQARQIIARQVSHLTRLVDDLLDVTRIARGKIRIQPVQVDLSAVARRTAEDHRAMFTRRDVALEVAADAPVWVRGDATRLSQVLGNLLLNSAKFTNPGDRVQLSVAREGERAVVRVRDSGVGIEPRVLEHLFEPFTQADETLHRSVGGLGLGLALVKGIVELHGGGVEASSAGPGAGAEFKLWLPLEPGTSPAPPLHAPSREGGKRRILLVEDNEDAATTLQMLLQLEGHEVHVAADGPHGLEAALALRPDVVLCDVGIPGFDGYELARRLRAAAGEDRPALVALTGYASPEDADRARREGFDHHVPKPPDLDTVLRIVAGAPERAPR